MPPLPANDEVIVAIATPPGRGGVGIVRISGKNIERIKTGILNKLLLPRHASLSSFIDNSNAVIDEGIALYFPAPHSFTGEEILELQAHGGPAVLQLLVQRCLELGARLAAPGEFTQRAFINGKLDLAQAESVADLIDATSIEAARSAMRSLQGEFSKVVHQIVDELIRLRVFVEATLDFPEEEIDIIERDKAREKLGFVRSKIDQVLSQAKQGSLLREGVHVVLIGKPNVGKSSLLNCLAGDEIAIVTPIAGTTRDPVRQHIHLHGIPLHMVDTAGLRETNNEIEQIGIERTWKAIDCADLILFLIDGTAESSVDNAQILEKLPKQLPIINIFNKIDLLNQNSRIDKKGKEINIHLSAKTGQGIDLLQNELLHLVGWNKETEHNAYMARARHVVALQAAGRHLENANNYLNQLEIFAEELKLAQNSLVSITGEFGADDLLGEIFSHFCIGK